MSEFDTKKFVKLIHIKNEIRNRILLIRKHWRFQTGVKYWKSSTEDFNWVKLSSVTQLCKCGKKISKANYQRHVKFYCGNSIVVSERS